MPKDKAKPDRLSTYLLDITLALGGFGAAIAVKDDADERSSITVL
jgi:hypothetical protein